ncbi:hypothetical protein [Vibrio alginolyticus]|uniref:hypothetical protein n=1 Tax=Vibrio alginolyticus TaxID=663 RepID=UPI0006CA7EA5|nr:hypothetical protein [Vibrio alginolyticus]KPM97592.1 hypothetical protein AOG25_14075 [Vibrio alginolyticus]CAH7368754.1 conserved hypothetical protein [Vibrio chagasii]
MKELIALMQDLNGWAELLQTEPYPKDPSKLTSKQRKELAEVIDLKLKPENLNYGLSASAAQRKATVLRTAQKELESLA